MQEEQQAGEDRQIAHAEDVGQRARRDGDHVAQPQQVGMRDRGGVRKSPSDREAAAGYRPAARGHDAAVGGDRDEVERPPERHRADPRDRQVGRDEHAGEGVARKLQRPVKRAAAGGPYLGDDDL
jgi:hypothetical protein